MYDRVPRQEVWRRNREKGLPYNYVRITQDRVGARTRAKTNVGPTWVVSEVITICDGNEGVTSDARSYQAGQNKD